VYTSFIRQRKPEIKHVVSSRLTLKAHKLEQRTLRAYLLLYVDMELLGKELRGVFKYRALEQLSGPNNKEVTGER
jgi:hypothetical protein